MTGRMYALSWDVGADGMLRLEQPCGCDEPAVIDLHPAQLRVLCELAGLLPPPRLVDATLIAGQLARVLDDADDLFRVLASVPCFPPGSGETEDVAMARRLVENIEDVLALVEPPEPEPVAGNENPAAISVTEKARPGRPATGKAMTNAERQAKHRAKQQELSLKGGHE